MDFFEPVRNPVKKTIGSFPGYVPSLKEGRMVACESTLERDFAILVEADTSVLAYSEQPITIEYVLDGKAHSYTPDFAVLRNGRIIFVEVKPEAKALRPEYVRKFAAVRIAFAKIGHRFVVLTEKDIRRQPRLRNAEFLHHWGRSGPANDELDVVVSELHAAGNTTVANLADRLGRPNAVESIYRAIAVGRVTADMSEPLGPSSQLCLTA